MSELSDRLDQQVREERDREVAAGTGTAARRARYRNRRNKNTDECPQGHAYTAENTIVNAANRRICVTCHTARRVHLDKPSGSRRRHRGRDVIDLTQYQPED